ncbi:MAG: RNA-binding protein, partial [Candidatus Thorarchaeota archaeon]
DERHRKPLCIARMLVDAEGLKQMERGKVAENIHHVGDRLWKAEK